MNVTLIISTYNRPEALKVCLESVKRQSVLPFEVVIGDDGSKEETVDLIKAYQQNFPVPLVHVWHEDDGFRLAMMRNKAVATSKGDYIIEVDGDIVLHRDFVKHHMHFARPYAYCKGGRVNLNKRYTAQVCEGKLFPSFLSVLLHKGWESKMENGVPLLPISSYLSERYRRRRSVGLGCNMSFWKKDFIAVNGYDEYFEGWGGEDIDFAHRLQALGRTKRYLKFSGIVYHLWHLDKYMYNKKQNFDYYHESKKQRRVRCEKGVDQYL